MLVEFADGTVKTVTEEEYKEICRESKLLRIAAVKDGYTEAEAAEMYSVKAQGE